MGERQDTLSQWLAGDGLAVLDHILGGAPDIVGVLDRELNIRYLSWATEGLKREDLLGQSVLTLVPPGYQEIARDTYLGVLRSGTGTRFETMYRSEHGMLLWEVRVGPIRHAGEVIGVVAITCNVTEQRREVADRDRFFSLSLDMLIVATPDGALKRVNPAFGEALGYGVPELVGVPFMRFVHPDDRARTREEFEALLRGEGTIDFENRYLRRDGAPRMFSWRATLDPVTGDVYAVARDITEQRATQAQLRHAQKMEAVGHLAGGIAHDFNNLMQAVLANVEIAKLTQAPSPALLEHLDEISGAGHRAAELTKQLLVFSRRQPLHQRSIAMGELLQDVMKLLRRLIPENITIDLRRDATLAFVSADPTQLEQVIINLCVNARDAMPGGGKLTIETDNSTLDERDCELHPWARPGRFVRLSVTDTGQGMPPEVLERVFDPFFTTKSDHRGTGLGLATVYGIVQQHGGILHVHSEVGRGSTFKVYLPAADRPPPSSHRAPSRAATAMKRSGKETILIAEDEEAVRRPLIQILEGAGYRTLAATNGLEAIRLLEGHRDAVDLVVLDLVMPELGGPDTWQRMRQLRGDLRVIFASGYADERFRDRLPPDTDVLEKPFRAEDLLDRIRAALDGPGDEPR